jgi:hypothetical protein
MIYDDGDEWLMDKDLVEGIFKIIIRHLPKDTEENH